MQKKSQIDKEVREMSLRFNQERGQFETELKRLRDLLEWKGREIEDLKSRNVSFENKATELLTKSGQNLKLEGKIS